MRRPLCIVAGLGVLGTALFPTGPAEAFTSVQLVTVEASATVDNGAANIPLAISAIPLSSQVFFEKNLVIGVDVHSTDGQSIPTTGLKIQIVYQLVDANNQPLGGTSTQDVIVQRDLRDAGHLMGSAYIPREVLTPIQKGGSVLYFFQVLQGTTATVLSHAGSGTVQAPSGIAGLPPSAYFAASVITSQQTTVYPSGSVVSLPDMYQNDGETTLTLPPGTVGAPTTLSIVQNDVSSLPLGPGGLQPVVAYTIQFADGSQPMRPVQLTLSYPADLSGNITGTNLNPNTLAPYRYNAGSWLLLSLPQLDSSLHTITATTTHFSTFALFPVGRVGAESLRPTQRIITPNGDHINDSADFGQVDSEIKIFDIHGRRVRTIATSPGGQVSWDGRDDDGHVVEIGVYLYQYSTQGTRVTGVIAVAK